MTRRRRRANSVSTGGRPCWALRVRRRRPPPARRHRCCSYRRHRCCSYRRRRDPPAGPSRRRRGRQARGAARRSRRDPPAGPSRRRRGRCRRGVRLAAPCATAARQTASYRSERLLFSPQWQQGRGREARCTRRPTTPTTCPSPPATRQRPRAATPRAATRRPRAATRGPWTATVLVLTRRRPRAGGARAPPGAGLHHVRGARRRGECALPRGGRLPSARRDAAVRPRLPPRVRAPLVRARHTQAVPLLPRVVGRHARATTDAAGDAIDDAARVSAQRLGRARG